MIGFIYLRTDGFFGMGLCGLWQVRKLLGNNNWHNFSPVQYFLYEGRSFPKSVYQSRIYPLPFKMRNRRHNNCFQSDFVGFFVQHEKKEKEKKKREQRPLRTFTLKLWFAIVPHSSQFRMKKVRSVVSLHWALRKPQHWPPPFLFRRFALNRRHLRESSLSSVSSVCICLRATSSVNATTETKTCWRSCRLSAKAARQAGRLEPVAVRW